MTGGPATGHAYTPDRLRRLTTKVVGRRRELESLVAALAAGIMFGIQPMLAHDAAGHRFIGRLGQDGQRQRPD